MRFGKKDWTNYDRGIENEWMYTNGRSAFSGSTIIGANSRKYHGLLIASLTSPEERYMILSKVEETLIIDDEKFVLNSTKYKNSIVEGFRCQQSFYYNGIPHFRYLVNGIVIDKKIVLEYGKNTLIIEYEIYNTDKEASLEFNPFMCFRNPGVCNDENNLRFKEEYYDKGIKLIPKLNSELEINIFSNEASICNKEQRVTDETYYDVDITTGDKYLDKFFIPGTFKVEIKPNEKKNVFLICTLEDNLKINPEEILEKEEKRISKLRNTFEDKRLLAKYLPISADHFIVNRDSIKSKTILAGYPWFLDWGRDAMIAINGITLATHRLEDAKEILRSFSIYEKNGLIPNMFPDTKQEPLYNTVDASLWYINAVYNYLLYSNTKEDLEFVEKELYETIKRIIKEYSEGTKFSIYMDEDGLIYAGSGLDQVTWMDVRVNGIVVTPRHGKPVEINALWYNALNIAGKLAKKFQGRENNEYFELAKKVKESFNKNFWNEKDQCLYDVVSKEESDSSIRPNQIWAISLPFTMLDREKEKKVVDKVFNELYTPYGLRSLSRGHKEYHSKYIGKLLDRDMAYHQGTVWGFPIGGFFTAYCKVNDYSKESVAFVDSLLYDLESHIENQCLGSIAEIFDGDTPHSPRGCYAQAWSVGEILRVYHEDIKGNIFRLKENEKMLFDNIDIKI